MNNIHKINNTQEYQKLRATVYKYFGSFHSEERQSEEEDISALFHALGGHGFMLAGGAITSLFTASKINDLDFYLYEKGTDLEAAKDFLESFFGKPEFESDNSLCYARRVGTRKFKVQLITRFNGTPEEIMDLFDFTICQGVYDFYTGEFVFGDRFFQDIARRRIVYCGKSHYPICAMYRTLKYQKRGYELPGSTVMHIALSIVRLDIKTYKQLKEQLMGIDTMYLQHLFSRPEFLETLPVDYGRFLVSAFEELTKESHDAEDFEVVDV